VEFERILNDRDTEVQEHRTKISQLQQELDRLIKENTLQESQVLEQKESEILELKRQLQEEQKGASDLREQFTKETEQAQSRIEGIRAELDQLRDENSKLKTQVSTNIEVDRSI